MSDTTIRPRLTMTARGRRIITEARRSIADGGTHDCGEWVEDGRCLLCDRSMPRHDFAPPSTIHTATATCDYCDWKLTLSGKRALAIATEIRDLLIAHVNEAHPGRTR